MKKRNRNYLFLSLMLSVSFHLALACLIPCNGLLSISKKRDNKNFAKQDEVEFLKTVFENISPGIKNLAETVETPTPLIENPIGSFPHDRKLKSYQTSKTDPLVSLKKKKLEESLYLQPKKTFEQFLCSQKLLSSPPKSNHSFGQLVKEIDLVLPKKKPEKSYPKPSASLENESLIFTSAKISLKEKKDHLFQPLLSHKDKNIAPLQISKHIISEKKKLEIPKKRFGFFKLQDLSTESCSEEFDTDLVFFPKEDGDGYVFALTLIPKPYVDFPKIKQNYFFLLDRSNGIGNKRFHITQGAVLKALSHLSEVDTFNILAFDNQIKLLSPHNISYGRQGMGLAKKFLDGISIGTIFSSSNVVNPLYSVLSYPSHEDDINIAILLTNGDGIAEVFNNRLLIEEWSLLNKGKVSLYSLNLSSDTQNLMMQMFSAFNKGKTLKASTLHGIKRQLLKLMKQIKHPIAKDLQFTAMTKNTGKPIELFTYLKPPHLYKDDPYVIMGEVKTLDDFVLFVQGRRNGTYLNIKKNVSFVDATAAHKRLKKDWVMQLAFEKYQNFVYEKDPKYLSEMRQLLSPYNIEASYQ